VAEKVLVGFGKVGISRANWAYNIQNPEAELENSFLEPKTQQGSITTIVENLVSMVTSALSRSAPFNKNHLPFASLGLTLILLWLFMIKTFIFVSLACWLQPSWLSISRQETKAHSQEVRNQHLGVDLHQSLPEQAKV
jgi:hypothetical protein